MAGGWTPVAYRYDGSFAGFLTCVFESYAHREEPMVFLPPEDDRVSLYGQREVATHQEHARRVYAGLEKRLGRAGRQLAVRAFLTCLEEKERHIYAFIRYGMDRGPDVTRDLADGRVAALTRAVTHLLGEVQLYRGFVRFSDQGGVLAAQIEPKNRVLPLLRAHFCARFSGECFVIYDRTHREGLFHRPGQWVLAPVEDFQVGPAGAEELDYRALWRRFYDTIAIEGRYNPKCRMTHMPKRYWAMMTEFQTDGDEAPPLPPSHLPQDMVEWAPKGQIEPRTGPITPEGGG